MIDLHSHYLFAVDDGADSLEISLELLKQARDQGIIKLLATPHVNAHTTTRVEAEIKRNFDILFGEIEKNNLQVQLKLAAEVNMIGSEIDWPDHSWVLIGEEQKYMLVETPFQQMPLDYSDILFRIRLKKITPIMAHPERNVGFQKDPKQLLQWIHQGTLVQVDAGSITGQFGPVCQRFSHRLLKADAVHLVASDAHRIIGRNYTVLSEAKKIVEAKYGSEVAGLLFVENPDNIWQGKRVSGGINNEKALEPGFADKFRRIFSPD
jgi:protein-tyrosine phosphatase